MSHVDFLTCAVPFPTGSGLTCYWMARTMNTVRQLVLRKGGKFITIVTYGPFGKRSKHSTVPVAHVSVKKVSALDYAN